VQQVRATVAELVRSCREPLEQTFNVEALRGLCAPRAAMCDRFA
jgi:hypothetical protein